MRASMQFLKAAVVAGLLLAMPRPAAADVYGFSCITNNSAGDCAILQNQLQMDVTGGGGLVNFRFSNSGPAASSITQVYFNDLTPPLLGAFSGFTTSAGVSFSTGKNGACSPPNLPGGSPYSFTTSYCADALSPTQPNGVNPGEWLTISYALAAGSSFAQVVSALNSGTYRVGIHVQGFASGGSESAISTVQQVPEPSALALVGGGFAAMLLRRRRAVRR